MPKLLNRYQKVIEKVFVDHYEDGVTEFEFDRSEFDKATSELGIDPIKNTGDILYSFRHRNEFPDSILATQPQGREWIIEGAGKGRYRFRLTKKTRVIPRGDLAVIDIPDATPEIIRAYAQSDEQALLAIIRYNRLIDIFLGITTYSLQNHLRTTVGGVGQIEIDELYVGLDKRGNHYIIPVQAKAGKDRIGAVQITQDIQFAQQKFPRLECRAIAVQFVDNEDEVVALFELTLQGHDLRIVEERHYQLTPFSRDGEKIT